MNIKDIKEIPIIVWLLFFSLLFPLLFSGSFFIFIFDRGTFNSLDIWKLLLLSSSGAAPLFLFNALVIYGLDSMTKIIRGNLERNDYNILKDFILGALIVALALYMPIFSNLFNHISLNNAVKIAVSFEIGIVSGAVLGVGLIFIANVYIKRHELKILQFFQKYGIKKQ